jgi:hypothetical protein
MPACAEHAGELNEPQLTEGMLLMKTALFETALPRLLRLRRRKLLPAGVTLLSAAAMLGAAAPAQAGLQQEMAIFDDCPVNAPNVITCVYSPVTSGEFKLGSKTVAINKTVLLQGAISSVSPDLVPAADGNTLSKTPLTVPGGLLGIEGLGGEVTATAELAGPVELNGANLLKRSGTAVSLPLKVKLDNPLLLNRCYIGSESQPVTPLLTTGTTSPPGPNTPISGGVGKFSFAAGQRITIVPASLVDNAFSVPGANGCGLLPLLMDPLVDLVSGVPAAAGHNTAIMNGALETSPVQAVKAQAALPEVGRCALAESTGEGKSKVFHGAYEDKGCTTEVLGHEGRYEWITGAAKAKFTAKSGLSTLAGAGGAAVACNSSSVSGEYTGAKTVAATVTFKGCKTVAGKAVCQSNGAAAGEMVASGLTGGLGFIEDEQTTSGLLVSVGVDLGNGSTLLSAQCDGVGEALVVKGSVIAPIAKIDAMSKTFTLTYAASAGKQSPEQFEGGSKDTLTATLGSGAEQAGLVATEKVANEEPLEIKVAANG